MSGEEFDPLLFKVGDPKALSHLVFAGNLYKENTFKEAVDRVGKSEGTATRRVRRWNEGELDDQGFREDLALMTEEIIIGERPHIMDRSEGSYMTTSDAYVVNWLTADNESDLQQGSPLVIALRYRKRAALAVAQYYRETSQNNLKRT